MKSQLEKLLKKFLPESIYSILIKIYRYVRLNIFRLLDIVFIAFLTIPCSFVAKRQRTPRSVVLITNNVGPRVSKIGYGLKSAGWHVILLYSNEFESDPDLSFNEIHQYRTQYTALLMALKYSPVVYHIFSSWNFDVAYLFMKCKPGKVVFDDYDVMAGMVKEDFAKKNYPGQMNKEHFCLENADGLCCRSHELKYAKDKMGYELSNNRIFFPEYCWNFPVNTTVQPKYPNDEIHIVYCGGIPAETSLTDDGSEGYQIWLANLLAEQQIHYHIYPPVNDIENYQGYIELNTITPFFHFHKHLDFINLIEEMKQYDFGLHITSKKIDLIENDTYIIEKADFAMSNKIFDYIDAEMPVIMYNAKLQISLLEKYKIAIDSSIINDNNLIIHLKNIKNNNGLKKNIKTAKSAYSIQKQIYYLTACYDCLCKQELKH